MKSGLFVLYYVSWLVDKNFDLRNDVDISFELLQGY